MNKIKNIINSLQVRKARKYCRVMSNYYQRIAEKTIKENGKMLKKLKRNQHKVDRCLSKVKDWERLELLVK